LRQVPEWASRHRPLDGTAMAESAAAACVVRILGPGGRTVGVGALVGSREVVTCAHVVNAALGWTRERRPGRMAWCR
jgi:hypothetical protein